VSPTEKKEKRKEKNCDVSLRNCFLVDNFFWFLFIAWVEKEELEHLEEEQLEHLYQLALAEQHPSSAVTWVSSL
jgi:hypothetical protein